MSWCSTGGHLAAECRRAGGLGRSAGGGFRDGIRCLLLVVPARRPHAARHIYLDQRFYELIYARCRSEGGPYTVLRKVALLRYKRLVLDAATGHHAAASAYAKKAGPCGSAFLMRPATYSPLCLQHDRGGLAAVGAINPGHAMLRAKRRGQGSGGGVRRSRLTGRVPHRGSGTSCTAAARRAPDTFSGFPSGSPSGLPIAGFVGPGDPGDQRHGVDKGSHRAADGKVGRLFNARIVYRRGSLGDERGRGCCVTDMVLSPTPASSPGP